MAEDDKNLGLLRDATAAFAGADVTFAVLGTKAAPDASGAYRGEVRRRGGRRHAIRLYPVRGALGLAAVDRIVAAAASRGAPVVVVASAAGREVRETLRTRGLGYLDLAGNCHLELDGGAVTLHVEGRRRIPRPAGVGSLRAAGYQALFTLLADESLLQATVREIATAAAVSRHAVHSLLERLREEGILARAGRSHHVFAPDGRAKCIDRFTTGWADVLRGRLLIGRFQLREREPRAALAAVERAFHAARVPFGFGGAHGSTRWLRYLEGDEIVVHTAGFGPELARQLGAVPARQGALFVFRTMTSRDFATDKPDAAHPLLVHAELARSADPRAREAAALLLDRIRPGARR